MSKVVKAFSMSLSDVTKSGGFREKVTGGPILPPSPDELAAKADAAEKRKRRSALGRESTILSGQTLGSANVGASLLSGK